VHPSELNSSAHVINDCSQQKILAVESHPVDEQQVCSSGESVKLTRTVDGSISQLTDEASCKMLKVDSSDVVFEKSVGCHDSEDGAVKTLPDKTLVLSDVSAAQPSCCDDIKGYMPKHEMPLSNLVPVMHVDLSNRVGRRRQCSQDGVVLLDRYVSVDAACVRCCSCSQLLSVGEFVRHVHHTDRVSAGSVRRLGPRGVTGPEWYEFQRRRAKFAVGVCSKAPVNPPTATAAEKDTSPRPAVNQSITSENASSVLLTVDEVVQSRSTENSVVHQDTVCSDVAMKLQSAPVSSEDTKSPGVEQIPPAAAIVDEVTKTVGDDVNVGSCRPLKAVVVQPSCPAAVDKTSAVPEPRLTRSRRTSVEPSPGTMSLRSQSTAVDIQPPAARHHERSCKRARMDAVATTPAHNTQSSDIVSSRVELRPRPPPRATAPK